MRPKLLVSVFALSLVILPESSAQPKPEIPPISPEESRKLYNAIIEKYPEPPPLDTEGRKKREEAIRKEQQELLTKLRMTPILVEGEIYALSWEIEGKKAKITLLRKQA